MLILHVFSWVAKKLTFSHNYKTLYEKTLPFIGSAPPSTYLYDGEQYIILHASGGTTLKRGYPNLVKTGNKLR